MAVWLRTNSFNGSRDPRVSTPEMFFKAIASYGMPPLQVSGVTLKTTMAFRSLFLSHGLPQVQVIWPETIFQGLGNGNGSSNTSSYTKRLGKDPNLVLKTMPAENHPGSAPDPR